MSIAFILFTLLLISILILTPLWIIGWLISLYTLHDEKYPFDICEKIFLLFIWPFAITGFLFETYCKKTK